MKCQIAIAFVALFGCAMGQLVVPELCGENEYVPPCVPCQQDCSDPEDMICTMDCKPPMKCYCKPGYLRNAQGKCVRKSECPKTVAKRSLECGENEYVPPCVPCRQDCTDPADMMCKMSCEEPTKCYCKPGYLRNAAGECVREVECPKTMAKRSVTCPENESVPPCIPCKSTCEHVNRRFCAMICIKTEKCFCNHGWLRAKNGTCIKEQDCAKFGGF